MALSGLTWTAVVCAFALAAPPARQPKKMLGLTTIYYQNSHADMIIGRVLQTETVDGKGRQPDLKMVSLYVDQLFDKHTKWVRPDKSRRLLPKYGLTLSKTPYDALTLGTGKLAGDGVLLIAEHGEYPRSELEQFVYPKRKWFEEVVRVSKASGRVVPVFIDKHLSDTWTDSKWIYDTAKEMKIPLMAGSSVPGTWRYPPIDLKRGAKVKQIVGLSFHLPDIYGFHTLEAVQCLAERRAGGETGVKSVQCYVGNDVWKAEEAGVYDRELLWAALRRMRFYRIPKPEEFRKLVPEPLLFVIEHNDGLRVCILTLDGATGDWNAAWRYEDGSVESFNFWTHEERPCHHFAFLVQGIEEFMHSGKPTWPVERTLLTSGVLDYCLRSKKQGGKKIETPFLNVKYQNERDWKQPPPVGPGRGWDVD